MRGTARGRRAGDREHPDQDSSQHAPRKKRFAACCETQNHVRLLAHPKPSPRCKPKLIKTLQKPKPMPTAGCIGPAKPQLLPSSQQIQSEAPYNLTLCHTPQNTRKQQKTHTFVILCQFFSSWASRSKNMLNFVQKTGKSMISCKNASKNMPKSVSASASQRHTFGPKTGFACFSRKN